MATTYTKTGPGSYDKYGNHIGEQGPLNQNITGLASSTQNPTYVAPPYTPIDPGDSIKNEESGNKRMDEAWQGIKDLPTAMTPEEKLKEQNRVVSRHEQQNAGMSEQIKAQMAASGMGGSGAEIGGIARAMSRGASGLSGELTDLGNKQATDEMNRKYQRSGLETGAASEFGQVGQGWDKARLDAASQANQQQNQLAYQKAQDEWSAQQYQQQYKQYTDMLNKIMPGLLGGGSGGGGMQESRPGLRVQQNSGYSWR